MNNKVLKNLIAVIATVLVLGSAMPTLAYVPGVWEPQPRFSTGESWSTPLPLSGTTTAPSQPMNTYGNQTQVIYSPYQQQYSYQYQQNQYQYPYQPQQYQYQQPPQTIIVYQTEPKAKAKTTTSSTTSTTKSASNTSTSNNTTVASNTGSNTNTPANVSANNNLGASAANSNNDGFMPSSILGWFIVIMLILGIVVLIRYMTKANPEHADASGGHH
jgi:ATP-dependent Zn protease